MIKIKYIYFFIAILKIISYKKSVFDYIIKGYFQKVKNKVVLRTKLVFLRHFRGFLWGVAKNKNIYN